LLAALDLRSGTLFACSFDVSIRIHRAALLLKPLVLTFANFRVKPAVFFAVLGVALFVGSVVRPRPCDRAQLARFT